MTAKFIKRQQLVSDIYTIYFQPSETVDQIAGQYIEMTIDHKSPDDRGVKRWFTLSNAPSEKYLSITTRLVEDKRSSFKQALGKLKAEDEINISDPMGDFVLPIDKKLKLLFVAGGIGITPFYSIIKDLKIKDEIRRVNLMYAARDNGELIDFSSYASYLDLFTPVTDRRLKAEEINQVANKIGSPLIYISGPEEMVEDLNNKLKRLGVAEQRLIGDYFPGYGDYLRR